MLLNATVGTPDAGALAEEPPALVDVMRPNRSVQSPSLSSNAVVSAPMPLPRMATEPREPAMSDLHEVKRLGELGARGVGWEPVEHAPDPVTPVRRALVWQSGQGVGGAKR